MIVLGPQVGAQDGAETLAFVWLYWTALMLSRACRTQSMAMMFGASHAWCLAFVGIALLSYYDRDRMLIPYGDEAAAFDRFLGWSAGALAVFGMLWRALQNPASWVARSESVTGADDDHALRKDSEPAAPLRPLFELSPSWLDWAREPRAATITPWLWQQLWMWSCLWLSSLLAAWLVLNHTGISNPWWLAFREPSLQVGFVLVIVSAWLTERRGDNFEHTLGLWSLAWMPVLSASIDLAPADRMTVWLAGWTTLAVVWALAARLTQKLRRVAIRWGDAASVGVVLLACWEFVTRHAVAWPASCVAVVGVITAVLGARNRSQWRAAASTTCLVLATAMAWTRDWDGLRARNERQVFWWLEAIVTALALAACAWQVVEVWWQARRGERFDPPSRFTAAEISSRIAFDAALSIVLLVALSRLVRPGWSIHDLGGWVMVLAVAAPFVVSWWDRFATRTISGVYGSLWLLLLMVLDSRELSLGDRWVTWLAGLIAVDVALVGVAWWIAKHSLSAAWHERQSEAERWLLNAQLVFAVAASVLVILGVLTFDDRGLRLWNVSSAALLVLGIALTARSQQRERLQRVALALGAVWAVEFLWAWMEPRPQADFWLQRSIRALEALAVTAFVYGVGLARWIRFDSDWRVAVERAARDVAFVAIATLLIVLGLEAWWFDPLNGAPVSGLQIAFVAAALMGLAAALLVMALSKHKAETAEPAADIAPQTLVYAAEILMGLLFLHVYLTMPELFRGYFRPYWPLIVMAIAFVGVGVSELYQRAKLKVLSEPFEHSAALLPLIPALGFWIGTSRLDYSTVLFLAGLVYVWLNLRRRSFWYVLAASLAGNTGLWSLWSEHGVELLVRPQVWLIPPAVSVLAAAQWNRTRLTEAQLAAIRYPAITLLYVSSAGEMFLTGIAESFWLPIVLMVLSVLGVLAGIWLRVRAFLYLGVSFLLLSLVSMVWHAAEAIDHTWPWWAFGIGLGLGVLTLFGLFERKRNEMLRLLGELRTWER